MRCLRPDPVVPPRFTTGYQLPSLRLEEIETASRKMRFIKLALMGREPPVAGHTTHAPKGGRNWLQFSLSRSGGGNRRIRWLTGAQF